jgi:mannose-1-phosphate guanylyltransferase
VRQFWEKPSRALAIDLMRRGCFWNSFIMAGRVGAFLSLVNDAVPFLFRSMHAIAPAFFTRDGQQSLLGLYLSIPSSSFSMEVLSACPGKLAVLCGSDLEWADVGDVDRALSLMEREGVGLMT